MLCFLSQTPAKANETKIQGENTRKKALDDEEINKCHFTQSELFIPSVVLDICMIKRRNVETKQKKKPVPNFPPNTNFQGSLFASFTMRT